MYRNSILVCAGLVIWRLFVRLFKVRVAPRPGESIASIEGGAMDFNDNQTYTFVIPLGTNQALCEEFEG